MMKRRGNARRAALLLAVGSILLAAACDADSSVSDSGQRDGPASVTSGAGVQTGAAGTGVGVVVVGDRGAAAGTATTTSVAATTAPVPITELEPHDVLAHGEAMPFRVCNRREGWQRPSPEEMREVFTDRRFGDGERPFPTNYALYLSRFFVIRAPTAASVNKERVAFSGQISALDGSAGHARLCDEQELRGALQTGSQLQSLWLIDHRVEEMRRLGGQLVVRVEDAPGTFEEVVFPFPPEQGGGQQFHLVQVVHNAGPQVYEERITEGGFAIWQAGSEGRMQFALIGGGRTADSWPLPRIVGEEPVGFTMYPAWSSGDPGVATVTDSDGQEVARLTWEASPSPWETAVPFALPPGAYRLGTTFPGGVLLLREGVPLPPE